MYISLRTTTHRSNPSLLSPTLTSPSPPPSLLPVPPPPSLSPPFSFLSSVPLIIVPRAGFSSTSWPTTQSLGNNRRRWWKYVRLISTARVVSTVCNKIRASHRYLTSSHRHLFLPCFWLSFVISCPYYHTRRSTIFLHFLYFSYTTPIGISGELFCQAFSFD